MHVPNPLGGLPLVLRSDDVSNSRNGELLIDYTKEYLYYIDKESGEKVGVADSIYKKIIESRLQNSKILITKSDSKGTEEEIPAIEDRKMNSFYFNINSRLEIENK